MFICILFRHSIENILIIKNKVGVYAQLFIMCVEGKMKKIFAFFLVFALAASYVSAVSGSIWTTNGDCGNETQDANHYAIGDTIYINGANFDANTLYDWNIAGLPGQASCDPGAIVIDGAQMTDANGAVCFAAYQVAADDCGEYKASFDNKQDNYRVEGQEVPEFGLVAAGLALIGALAIFAFTRKH